MTYGYTKVELIKKLVSFYETATKAWFVEHVWGQKQGQNPYRYPAISPRYSPNSDDV